MPRPCSCSSGTESSPARRCWPRVSKAGTRRPTACSRCSRNAVTSVAATSLPGSAPHSSPCRVRSTGCVRPATCPTPQLHPELMPAAVVLASTDPAQPYGAALDWPGSPGRPSRTAGAVVVLRSGVPLAWFDRRSSHLVTFPASADGSWAEALATLVKDGRQRSVEIRKVNGAPIDRQGGEAVALLAAGFVEGYRGFRAARRVSWAAQRPGPS